MATVGFNVDIQMPDLTPQMSRQLTEALAEGRVALEMTPVLIGVPDIEEDVPIRVTMQARVVQVLPANNSPWGNGVPVIYEFYPSGPPDEES